jgi:hypothetical protein
MTSFACDARPARITTFDSDTTFRKDTHMYQAEIRLADIRELHEQHRSIRHGERHGERHGSGRGRSIRRRVGESLMRLGRRVGGEALTDTLTTPAWQG